MNGRIRGIGTAVPAHTMSQEESKQLAHEVICQNDLQRRLLSVLYRKAGVSQRYTVLPHRIALEWLPAEHDSESLPTEAATVTSGPTTHERMLYYAEHAPPLAEQAARRALAAAKSDAAEITHLVTVSCTGFDAPGIDTSLMIALGLSPTTQRIQVGFMGCHGAINGLRVAQALTAADPKARVLLVAVELCSLHYRFQWDPDRIIANALFGDGAAAVVLGGESSHDQSTQPRDWHVAATGSTLIPDSRDAMTWRIGDHGFEMTLHGRVPDLIQQHLRPWLTHWLADRGHTLDSVGSWAIHPGGPRILSAIEESLGLPREATAVSREVLTECGNMSSPTVLFIVDRLERQNAPLPCVALGFGPGMFAEVALFA